MVGPEYWLRAVLPARFALAFGLAKGTRSRQSCVCAAEYPMKKSFRYNLVDVFTDVPLAGNPLAVFTRADGLSSATMQAVAREMNLSETVFFFPPELGGHARLRIFTPRVELPFAGHPILGSAWVLGQPIELPTLRLETNVGMVTVDLYREGGVLDLARMTQPLPVFRPTDVGVALYEALGYSGPHEQLLSVVHAHNGPEHLLVELPSRETIQALTPDLQALARLNPGGTYVFAQEGTHCFARYFAPALGVSEDPATGSAAGPLGAYLVRAGRLPSEATLTVFQGEVMHRPSTLLVEAKVEGEQLVRVTVAGRAVVLARGELLL